MTDPTVVIGAGPAGLTAALKLVQAGRPVLVLEASEHLGGLSRTEQRDGWRFDLGGHRFFTKSAPVQQFWHDLLGEQDFLLRPRLSRIFYRGRFFDYPIKPFNALRNLGPVEAVRCLLSYLRARVAPPADPSSLEAYIVASYGWRLYRHFFATYNAKVWGVPASQLSADWGAQRIKGMSLWTAVVEPIRAGWRRRLGRRPQTEVTSLIEQFRYPRLGPGMMWERCAERVRAGGGGIELRTPVVGVERVGDRVTAVITEVDGRRNRVPCSAVISSMPLAELVRCFTPAAPDPVIEASRRLRFRDFLTVALVVDEADGFQDNWIYVHGAEVQVGRIQNFGRWSPDLVKDGRTCLGCEYFVHQGDGLWERSDDELIALATAEVAALGLVPAGRVRRGFVVRVPKAYPIYDTGYADRVEVLRDFLAASFVNLWPVGRNGMHRYNNQDHSMLTAMLAVENVLGAEHDVWAVNVDTDYHEETSAGAPDRCRDRSWTERAQEPGSTGSGAVRATRGRADTDRTTVTPRSGSGTGPGGRDAPIVPGPEERLEVDSRAA